VTIKRVSSLNDLWNEEESFIPLTLVSNFFFKKKMVHAGPAGIQIQQAVVNNLSPTAVFQFYGN
jgi:hypothetical protein